MALEGGSSADAVVVGGRDDAENDKSKPQRMRVTRKGKPARRRKSATGRLRLARASCRYRFDVRR